MDTQTLSFRFLDDIKIENQEVLKTFNKNKEAIKENNYKELVLTFNIFYIIEYFVESTLKSIRYHGYTTVTYELVINPNFQTHVKKYKENLQNTIKKIIENPDLESKFSNIIGTYFDFNNYKITYEDFKKNINNPEFWNPSK